MSVVKGGKGMYVERDGWKCEGVWVGVVWGGGGGGKINPCSQVEW